MRASVITKIPALIKHEYKTVIPAGKIFIEREIYLESTGNEELDASVFRVFKKTMDDMIHGQFMTGKQEAEKCS